MARPSISAQRCLLPVWGIEWTMSVDMPELQSIKLGLNAMKYHGNDSYDCALVLSSTNEMT